MFETSENKDMLKGWVYVSWEKRNISQRICSCICVYEAEIYQRGEKSHDLIQARCQRLERKTLGGFSKTHRIGQLDANCETQRLVLIHSSCLEENVSLSKFQKAHILRTS